MTKTTKPTHAYRIADTLYLNITNACTSDCSFCPRTTEPVVRGYDLKLPQDPSAEELIQACGNPKSYDSVVFCGFGEPTLRLPVVLAVAGWLKKSGARVRLNTNGHGNLIHKRSIVPDLQGLMDEISISLNASDAKEYADIMKPAWGLSAFSQVIAFIKECQEAGLRVSVTGVDFPGFRRTAFENFVRKTFGIAPRIRSYNRMGDQSSI